MAVQEHGSEVGKVDTLTARRRLEEIRDEIDKSITVLRGHGSGESVLLDYPRDAADAGANLSESERARTVIDLAGAQRGEVQEALRRIELGTYGKCTDCGVEVPEGRLEAKPEAARCMACQAKWARQWR